MSRRHWSQRGLGIAVRLTMVAVGWALFAMAQPTGTNFWAALLGMGTITLIVLLDWAWPRRHSRSRPEMVVVVRADVTPFVDRAELAKDLLRDIDRLARQVPARTLRCSDPTVGS